MCVEPFDASHFNLDDAYPQSNSHTIVIAYFIIIELVVRKDAKYERSRMVRGQSHSNNSTGSLSNLKKLPPARQYEL